MFANPTANKSIFSRNTTSSNFIVTISSSDGGSSNQSAFGSLYDKLAPIVQTLDVLMTEYANGNFYAVANILTLDAYNSYSISLANLAQSPIQYPNYEILRMSTVNTLAGLYQSMLQYSNYLNLEEQLRICREHEEILYNPTLLNEFLSRMRQNRQLFPDSTIEAPMATLKPEYAIYIAQFGFPQSGVFDPERLAYILQNM